MPLCPNRLRILEREREEQRLSGFSKPSIEEQTKRKKKKLQTRSAENIQNTNRERKEPSQVPMAISYNPKTLVICAAILFLILASFPSSTAQSAAEHQAHLGFVPTGSFLCKGTIAECLENEELELDREISRRILATNRYISYGALRRNSVPCSRRGASYYNCRQGAQANPYTRGCSAITRCRR